MKSAFFVYTTFPSFKVARKVAIHLIEKKLVVCVNIFKIDSYYNWKGKIENSKEFIAIFKTDGKRVNKAIEELEKIHPYEIPFIAKIPLKVCEKYFKWMISEK